MDFIDLIDVDQLRKVAQGYEDEMREALAKGDMSGARLWRDLADTLWASVERRRARKSEVAP